jgi:hypothetical protein
MDQQTLLTMTKQLDQTVEALTFFVLEDLYHKRIPLTVENWFQTSQPISALNAQISKIVEDRWPYLEQKIRTKLLEFEQYTVSILAESTPLGSAKLSSQQITEAISPTISAVSGLMGTTLLANFVGPVVFFAAVLTFPLGWIAGFIIGTLVLVFHVQLKRGIGRLVYDLNIPAFLKQSAYRKVMSQFKAGESEFKLGIFWTIRDHMKPIYEALQSQLTTLSTKGIPGNRSTRKEEATGT